MPDPETLRPPELPPVLLPDPVPPFDPPPPPPPSPPPPPPPLPPPPPPYQLDRMMTEYTFTWEQPVCFSLGSTKSIVRVLKIRNKSQVGSCADTGDARASKTKDANNTDKKRNLETFILNNDRMTWRKM